MRLELHDVSEELKPRRYNRDLALTLSRECRRRRMKKRRARRGAEDAENQCPRVRRAKKSLGIDL